MATKEAEASSLEMDIRPAKESGEVHQTLLSENGDATTKETTKEPIDKFYIVYIIFIVHGIGVLMPWNMFITANDYFVNYKLAPSTNGTTTDGGEKTVYQNYFLGVLGFVAQIPTVIINGVNTFSHSKGGNISSRIVWSIIVVVIMFVATIALAMVDSSEWPAAFFWLTMVSVVIINMANGIYQNSIFGTAACLPMKYPNAVVIGSNISGTLTSVIMLISIAGTPNPRTSAIFYFLAAIFILLMAFDTFYILDFLPFYRYHSNKGKKPKESHEDNSRPPYLQIFKQCWKHDLSVFLVFFVTLSVFPAVQANIRASDPNFFISEKYYSPVTCFLLFNLFAVVGNVISAFIQKPGPRWAWIPITLRLFFIPFFMFCNFNPTSRNLPVLISNDYVYIVGAIAMAVTSGYFSSLAMMYAPDSVKNPEHKGVAGMMAAFFLVLGIFIGVTFSIPVTMFITNVGSGGSGSSVDEYSTVSYYTNTSSLLL